MVILKGDLRPTGSAPLENLLAMQILRPLPTPDVLNQKLREGGAQKDVFPSLQGDSGACASWRTTAPEQRLENKT